MHAWWLCRMTTANSVENGRCVIADSSIIDTEYCLSIYPRCVALWRSQYNPSNNPTLAHSLNKLPHSSPDDETSAYCDLL